MPNYEITLTVREPDKMEVLSHDVISSTDIVHLLSQFNITLVMALKKQQEEEKLRQMMEHDDIPF